MSRIETGRWPLVRKFPGILLAIGATLLMVGIARADPAKLLAYGQHLAHECTSCHRGDGIDNGIPSIVGWDAAIFSRTLQFYRLGERTNSTMVSVAQSLDDHQVQALAAYYSTLPKPRTRSESANSR